MSKSFIESQCLEIAGLKLPVLSMEKGNILIISKSDVLKIMQLSGRGFFTIPETTAEIIFGNDEKWDVFFFKGMDICVMRNSAICPATDAIPQNGINPQENQLDATGASEGGKKEEITQYCQCGNCKHFKENEVKNCRWWPTPRLSSDYCDGWARRRWER